MSNETSDELHHAGRKGMKWGLHIFGRQRSRTRGFGRKHRPKGNPIVKGSSRKKLRRSVDEQLREAQFIEQYRNRDRMSTRDLKNKIARLESEQKFKTLVEAPQKARLEAQQKKRQARLNYIGKIASAGLDVYSKMPASFAVRNKTGKEREAAAKAFKKSQEWAKAFKDVPTTMTTFKQSINVGGVDVYIPESVQNRFMIQHAGRKGMKWGMNIFGKRDRYARNNFSKSHYETYRYVRNRVKKGKLEYKLSKKIHLLTKDLYNSQPTEQNRLLTNMAYDAQKEANVTRKKYKGSVKKIFNKYSETDFDLKGGLSQSGVNMGEIINGVYIPSQEDLLLHYGKKGMKWKKRRGINPGEALGDLMTDVNEERIRNLQRDYDTRAKNMEANIRKVKSGVRNGKTVNPNEQRYHDEYRKNAKAGMKAAEEITKAKDLHNRIKKARSKNVKHMAEDDILLHYGKKGMKWKKRRGINPGEALGDLMNEANEQRIRDLERDSSAYQQNMASNISKIKSNIRKGKTKNPKEQKYLDAYNENGGKYMKTYVDSEQAKSLRDRIKKARAKRK